MPRMSAEQTARLESSIGRARKGIRQVSSPAATTTTINSSRVIPYDDRFMEIKVISGWRHKSRKIRQISHSIPRSSLVKPLRLSPIPLKTQPTLRFELRRAGSCLPHSPPHIIIIYIYASWQKTCFFTHSFARRANKYIIPYPDFIKVSGNGRYTAVMYDVSSCSNWLVSFHPPPPWNKSGNRRLRSRALRWSDRQSRRDVCLRTPRFQLGLCAPGTRCTFWSRTHQTSHMPTGLQPSFAQKAANISGGTG